MGLHTAAVNDRLLQHQHDSAMKQQDLPLLHRGGESTASSTASSPRSTASSSRVASEDLIVPAEHISSIYYGVDAFSPTLVDFYTADQKRIVWSSRAHRKMMTTLYYAWNGKPWKLYSLSFWGGLFAVLAQTLFLVGFMGEAMAHSAVPEGVHRLVDLPLLAGAVCYLLWQLLSYFEVINCCHNLEMWLDEYFHGREPLLEKRFLGFFPSRIDYWTVCLGSAGSMLFLFSRAFLLLRNDAGANYGVIDVGRSDFALILGYWLPFFVGSFFMLLSAYLAHVEVVHQWFSWRLTTLETWVTGLNWLSALGFFLASTLQFVDPFSVLFSFEDCMVPFGFGCFLGLCSAVLSLVELDRIHQRHKHPEYGLLKHSNSYGSTWGVV